MLGRQQERLAADDASQLAEGDDRAGEGDRPDHMPTKVSIPLILASTLVRGKFGSSVVPKPMSTAARPTKPWSIATIRGMEVISTRAASTPPMPPPTTSATINMP